MGLSCLSGINIPKLHLDSGGLCCPQEDRRTLFGWADSVVEPLMFLGKGTMVADFQSCRGLPI